MKNIIEKILKGIKSKKEMAAGTKSEKTEKKAAERDGAATSEKAPPSEKKEG